jgi:hypothetical protein
MKFCVLILKTWIFKMHYSCLETSVYVAIAYVIFHHTIIDQMQIQHCSKTWEAVSCTICHGCFGFGLFA